MPTTIAKVSSLIVVSAERSRSRSAYPRKRLGERDRNAEEREKDSKRDGE